MASTSQNSLYTNPLARTYTAPPSTDNSAEIKQFYESLSNFAPTRLVPLYSLAKEIGVKNIFVKAETSRLGLPSFKLLGASWAIRQAIIQRCNLSPYSSLQNLGTAAKEAGIKLCAATDGNHGRAVARMGKLLGVSEVRIFVPKGLDEGIIGGIKGEGNGLTVVEMEVVEGSYDECVRIAHQWGKENRGGMLIEGTAFEGYEDVPKWTVEGYTTMLHEIGSQLSLLGLKPSAIVTPCGVGSLAQAIVTHYKSKFPDNNSPPTAVLTVEPRTAGSLHESLKKGESISIETSSSIMTGLECGTISAAAWPVLKGGVDVSVTVGDWEVHEAVLELDREGGVKAGPCGAAALAGFRFVFWKEEGRKVLGLDGESVVVLVCTEGEWGYKIPDREA